MRVAIRVLRKQHDVSDFTDIQAEYLRRVLEHVESRRMFESNPVVRDQNHRLIEEAFIGRLLGLVHRRSEERRKTHGITEPLVNML